MSSLYRVLIFLALFAPFGRFAYAQQQDKELSKQYMDLANEMLEGSRAVDDAREQMVNAANYDTTNIIANFLAGSMHVQTINKDQAVKYFMRVLRQDPSYRFDIEYWIASSYQFGLNFDKAINYYNISRDKVVKKPNYSGKDKVDIKEVDRRIQECKNGKQFVADPQPYSITNLGKAINSEYEDYAPILNANENEMVFTTRRRDGNTYENVADDNKPYEDIFIAEKSEGVWQRAKNIGPPINTKTFDSDLTLSADGKILFIYKDDGAGDIYFSERNPDGTWSVPKPLPGSINSSYREASITITADGNTLYFVSQRPGGLGGSDIYICTKDSKGEWTKVKNLGNKINTEFDEDGVFIDYDQKTLYFSSKGHNGMGDYDIYKSTLLNPDKNEWSEPENLGYPVNSPDGDIYFVSTKGGKNFYYSTVRDEGLGYTDIYLVTRTQEKKEPVIAKKDPEPVKEEVKKEPVKEEVKKEPVKEEVKKPDPVLKFVVTVVDENSKSPLDSKVRMMGAKDNVMLGVQSNGPGVYEFSIISKTPKDYRISVEKEGYVFQNMMIKIEGATDKPKTISRTIEMKKLAVGVVSILRNIYFDFGKATFQTQSYGELNKLESMMKQNSNLHVEIAGHTDALGKKDFNKQLSDLRARAVKSFLVSKGIDPRRVEAVGYGEEKPLASNDDEEEGRQYNRRVEFKVIGN